ncbi:PH domain-containing protein [Actinokineospora xionganensis]|uniref:PH domain-containing protein n=1 Tax=Actinokineospora xionganensis TaxID=2684470 RepID=A0ABR7L6C1_9PSEU|nr:PH domain-containing protein [Actinokineospora xionganensis]MBC6447964.1 PH domain-containing protein [Actinokineospora xionganensis]
MDNTEWRLRAPANLVSKRAILHWTLSALIGWVIVLGGQGIHLLVNDDPPAVAQTVAIVSVVVALVHVLVMPRWRYAVHRWETNPDAVFTRSGWINQEWRLAPVSRIQTVDTVRGPLQQLLKLATVTVTTASAAGPVKIENLDASVAARLSDELASTTQATPGDAT